MPQSVQNLWSVPSQSFQARMSGAQTQNDGPSFEQTLDEARNRDAQQSSDAPGSGADAVSKAGPAGPDRAAKTSGKKPVRKGERASAAKKTKDAAPSKTQADGKPDAQGNADAPPQDQQPATPDDAAKQKETDKKDAAAAPAGTAVDTVQLQAALAPVQGAPAPAANAPQQAKEGPAQPTPDRGQAKAVVGQRQTSDKSTGKDDSASAGKPSTDAASAPLQNVPNGASGSTAAAALKDDGKKPALAIQAKKAGDSKDSKSAGKAAPSAAASLPASDGTAAAGGTGGATAAATAPVSGVPHSGPRAVDSTLIQSTGGIQSPVATALSGPGTFKIGPADSPDAAPPSPEAEFADANHAKIVAGIHGQLLPNGGAMQMRLDPPDLGIMHVRVEMRDGVMTASFETTSDQATKLLSHSLGDLKTALEAQGVSVDKLQVRQAPKQDSSPNNNGNQSSHGQDRAHQQEQQRKEMVRRMWRRLAKTNDPLDLVA